MRTLGLGLVISVAAAAPAAASTTPDRTITLSAQAPVVKFGGGPMTDFDNVWNHAGVDEPDGTPVGADRTLARIESAGKLTVHTSTAATPGMDVDLTLYTSDESGAPGARITPPGSYAAGPEETVTHQVKVGHYLLVASGYPTVATTFDGTATLAVDPVPPAAPPVSAGDLPAQSKPAKPAGKRRAWCAKKARSIKNAKKRRAALRRCARAKRTH